MSRAFGVSDRPLASPQRAYQQPWVLTASTAVTACKLCFIHADKINLVRRQYPELGVRLARCSGNTVSTPNTAPLFRSRIF